MKSFFKKQEYEIWGHSALWSVLSPAEEVEHLPETFRHRPQLPVGEPVRGRARVLAEHVLEVDWHESG